MIGDTENTFNLFGQPPVGLLGVFPPDSEPDETGGGDDA